MNAFDVDQYRLPSGSTADLLALARALESACDGDAPDNARKAMKKVRATAAALAVEWDKKDAIKPMSARDADTLVDRAHKAIDDRLAAYALVSELLDDASGADAAAVRARLYPDGLGFLKLKFHEEWAESDKRVRRIEDEGLRPALERLAGKMFVDALSEAHARYGVALGITKADTSITAVVIDAYKALVGAIEQYIRVVAWTVFDDEPEVVELATRLLRPVVAYRERTLAAMPGKKRNPSDGSTGPVDVPSASTDSDGRLPTPVR